MNDAPTAVYDVSFVRNTGSSMGGDLYDDGVPIVVGGVTPSQGDGNAGHRAKWGRSGNFKGSMSEEMRDATDEAQK